jgi:hypothetical protein
MPALSAQPIDIQQLMKQRDKCHANLRSIVCKCLTFIYSKRQTFIYKKPAIWRAYLRFNYKLLSKGDCQEF